MYWNGASYEDGGGSLLPEVGEGREIVLKFTLAFFCVFYYNVEYKI